MYGGCRCSGVIRSHPDDFQVDEVTSVEAEGTGEHVLVHIEKRNTNTDWIAGRIARLASVPRRDVSYAGMKDRHALTRQWFSVRLAGRKEPDWEALSSADLRIIASSRHSRKLRRGALKGNRFRVLVRGLEGDLDRLEWQLQSIEKAGIANYFGEQRFGHGGGNLEGASIMFKKGSNHYPRRKKGIYLSAARGFLFNRVLAYRVAMGNWNSPLLGDRMILDGTRNSFQAATIDAEIARRVRSMEVHPSGPLWGRGAALVCGEAERVEEEVLKDWEGFRVGLQRAGLKQERRSLRSRVGELNWSVDDGLLEINCFLPRGSYFTAMLRELVDYRLPE